jgi:tetratricopeptide (TPR) repeat protein
MQLITFGKVHLVSCDFSRPKPLLLLSYITLEGPQERRRLADLFWLDTSNSANEVQKKLGKLSVVLAQFKKEGVAAFPEKAGLDPLPSLVTCDALEFLNAIENNHLEDAIKLYQAPFLHDLDKSLAGLEVSAEILDWVLEKREWFAEKARAAMLQLAEEAYTTGDLKSATQLAERAYGVAEAPELEPAQLSRLQYLLGNTKSSVTKQIEKTVKASLDEISPTARDVFLALSLQSTPHLAAIREALKLSIDVLSQAREELLFSGLVDAQSQIIAKDMAHDWLMRHPAERVPLLMKVVRATPPEEAFELYRSIYQETKGFGGIGDVQKAHKAYYLKAKALMDAREFSSVVEALAELREVERLYEVETDLQCCFLEAYGLERMGRFKEAFERVQSLPDNLHNPNIIALTSVLLWRSGKSAEAKCAAETALKSGLEWMWAKATANNTLGYVTYSNEELLESASFFKKAASMFQTAGENDRWVGCLNNYANALDMTTVFAERQGKDKATIDHMRQNAEAAYQAALEALDQVGENNAQRARILLNLGTVWESAKDWQKAEKYYLEALTFVVKVSDLEINARLHLNMGTVYSMMQQLKKAKENYSKAIHLAAEAGEYAIQGLAAANVAKMEQDPDSLESALELLEQSGQQEQYPFFEDDYETILKMRLEESLAANDLRKAHHLLLKLRALYQKQHHENKVGKIKDALNALAHINNPGEHREMLLSLINDQSNFQLSLIN